jgi:hypothetical protein
MSEWEQGYKSGYKDGHSDGEHDGFIRAATLYKCETKTDDKCPKCGVSLSGPFGTANCSSMSCPGKFE